MKSARICKMNKIVVALIVASATTLVVYFYVNTSGTQVKGGSPAAATVSVPVKSLGETKKSTPELKSLDGLDKESNAIFSGNGVKQSPGGDPLKAATQ